jgi:tripartite-type tricarboxylate transporter receptor subunit TctC
MKARQARVRSGIPARCIAVAIAAALALPAQHAHPQDYPSKPVRMIAGMAAGGGADANARRLAQMLNRILKQNIVVENIAGAAGWIEVPAPPLPKLPTFNESGIAGFEAGVGHGILVHAGTPADRVTILNRAINNALTDVDYKKQMTDVGVVLVGGTPEHFRSYLAAERRKWGEVIQKRGIKVD